MATIQVKRGTRSQLESAKLAGNLKEGEPYLITDESSFAVGLGSNSYKEFRPSEGLVLSTSTKTANYNLTNTDHTIRGDASAGNILVYLPTATSSLGRVYAVKKVDSTGNSVGIVANGVDTIDGVLVAYIYTKNAALTVQSNGTSWDII